MERQDHILGSLPPGYEQCPHSNRIYTFVRNLRYRVRGKTFK